MNETNHNYATIALKRFRAYRADAALLRAGKQSDAINRTVERILDAPLRDLDGVGELVQSGVLPAGRDRRPWGAYVEWRAFTGRGHAMRPTVAPGREVVSGDSGQERANDHGTASGPRAGKESEAARGGYRPDPSGF